jgi:hypothetical protein
MSEVLALFRRAIDTDDATAMREGLDLLFSAAGGLSVSDEFDLRHEDYVMEMPQSGERITGRDRMRAMQESFPGPPPSIRGRPGRAATGSGQESPMDGGVTVRTSLLRWCEQTLLPHIENIAVLPNAACRIETDDVVERYRHCRRGSVAARTM